MQKDQENIDRLIARYLSSEATEKEKEALEKWMKENDGNRFVVNQLEKLTYKSGYQTDDLKISDHRLQIWNRINKDNRIIRRRNLISIISKVAAVFIIITSTVLFVNLNDNERKINPEVNVEVVHKIAKSGQKLTLQLPDGSFVKLNAESEIIFPSIFPDSIRKVELIGEAFFEVEKDTLRPFIVKSEFVQTTVLGTSFNIKAYPDEDEIEVALLTGKVNVEDLINRENRYFINPGQSIKMDNEGNRHISLFDYQSVFGWKENLLIFNESSFQEIIKNLERWYGVEFIVQGNIPDWDYKGTFSDASLKEVLEVMSNSEGFDYNIIKDEVIIIL